MNIPSDIVAVVWLIVGLYLLAIVAIVADLISGVRKAKQRGEMRTSYGFRRTFDKTARYMNVMFAFTILDAMQLFALYVLNVQDDLNLLMFPFCTLIAALGVGCVELKSILEKADAKGRKNITEIEKLIAGIMKNGKDINKVIEQFNEYLNKNETA